jgi:hypothetical protein
MFEADQGRVARPLADLQRVLRKLFDAPGESPPVHRVRDNVFRMSRSSVPWRTCSLGRERANRLSYRHSGGERRDFSRMSRGVAEAGGSFDLAPACHNVEIARSW